MDTNHHGDLNPAPSGFALSGKVMLIATVSLFSVVLLLLFLHLYLRSRLLLHRRRHRRLRRRLAFAVNGAVGSITSFSSRRGLDHAVLNSLAVQVFTAGFVAAGGEEDEEGVECAVCLSEFEDGEKLRVLSRCGHRFHIECIDMWFHSHATCPLCRTIVEAPPPLPPTTARPAMPPVPSSPEPGQPSLPDLCLGEGEVGSSASSSGPRGLGIEVPCRGSSEGELGLELKSPRNPMLMLTRLLIRDSRHNRCVGAAAGEPDLERGEGAAASGAPTPR